uniref:Mitotic checkpoint protein BUB3 n=1 Tax=Anthurium amnicola TaxID=1678845 RepID=A0A1D1YCC5_9ARAE
MPGSSVELERPIGDAISRVRFAPRSGNLLISSWDSILRLYDVDASEIRLEAASEGALLDCCFHDEWVAFSSSSDYRIRRYDLPSGKQEVMGKHDDVATCVDYSEETGQLISAGLDKKLMLWDIHATNRKSGSLEMDTEVTSLSLCGYYIVVAVGTLTNVYDSRSLKGALQSEGSSMDYQLSCVRSLSKNEGFVVGSVDGRVALKFLEASRPREMGCIFHCHPRSMDRRRHLVTINDIAVHPLHDTFVTGDNEGYAIIWDAQSKKRLFEFPRHINSVASLSYNHSGQKLAIACSHTYQNANEMEETRQILIHEVDNLRKPLLVVCRVAHYSKSEVN